VTGPTGRFPGFDSASKAGHWDPVTAGVVLSRTGRPPDMRFFSPAEEAAATALCGWLLGQDCDPKVLVVPQIDARLADQETDGWRYADMPEDGQAWRDSLRFLDKDSRIACSCEFARAPAEDQRAGPPRQVWRLSCLRTASEFTGSQGFIIDFLVHFRWHIAAVRVGRVFLRSTLFLGVSVTRRG